MDVGVGVKVDVDVGISVEVVGVEFAVGVDIDPDSGADSNADHKIDADEPDFYATKDHNFDEDIDTKIETDFQDDAHVNVEFYYDTDADLKWVPASPPGCTTPTSTTISKLTPTSKPTSDFEDDTDADTS